MRSELMKSYSSNKHLTNEIDHLHHVLETKDIETFKLINQINNDQDKINLLKINSSTLTTEVKDKNIILEKYLNENASMKNELNEIKDS